MTIFEYLDAANNAIDKANCESFSAFCAIMDISEDSEMVLAKQAWEEAVRLKKKRQIEEVKVTARILCSEYKRKVLEKGNLSMKEFDDAIGAYGFMRTSEALKWKNGA